MVGHVKNFGEVNRHGQRAVWRTWIIEAPSYSMSEGEEGGNGGMVGTEAMLGGRTIK